MSFWEWILIPCVAAVISSWQNWRSTLKPQQAIEEILRFLALVLDDIQVNWFSKVQRLLILHDREQPKRMFSYATFLMLVHSLMCWLSDQRIHFSENDV